MRALFFMSAVLIAGLIACAPDDSVTVVTGGPNAGFTTTACPYHSPCRSNACWMRAFANPGQVGNLQVFCENGDGSLMLQNILLIPANLQAACTQVCGVR